MDTSIITTILTNLSGWLSGGTVSIVLGIIGLGGIVGGALYFINVIKKKIQKAQYEKQIRDAGAFAGSESGSLSEEMRENKRYLDAQVAYDRMMLNAKLKPVFKFPENIYANELFTVQFVNVPENTILYIDEDTAIGPVLYSQVQFILKEVGKRTLYVTVNGIKVTVDINVESRST